MKNFFNKGKSGPRNDKGRGGYKGGNKFGGPGRGGQSNMHPATCDQCHSACEVPFRPTGQQPVLCFECFRKKEGRDTRPHSGNQRFERSGRPDRAPRGNSDGVTRELKALNDKMDMIINALSEEASDEDLNFD